MVGGGCGAFKKCEFVRVRFNNEPLIKNRLLRFVYRSFKILTVFTQPKLFRALQIAHIVGFGEQWTGLEIYKCGVFRSILALLLDYWRKYGWKGLKFRGGV